MKKLVLLASLFLCGATCHAITIGHSASNAIRDYPRDGSPDELTPSSSNYVFNRYQMSVGPTSAAESRAYAELNLSSLTQAFDSVYFSFSAFRYNSPNVAPQTIDVYAYDGDGTISLSDWYSAVTYAGSTDPIQGHASDGSNRGEGINFSLNVTGIVSDAISNDFGYLGFYFRNPHLSVVNSGDPLGYSSLVTVGNFRLETREQQHAVPDAMPTGLALLPLLLSLVIWRRCRS